MKRALNILAALLATALNAAPLATTNYVQSALSAYDARVVALIRANVATNVQVVATNAASTAQAGDFVLTNGVAAVVFRDADGTAAVTRHFAVTSAPVHATLPGCLAVSSTIAALPVGTTFAGVGGPARFVNAGVPLALLYSEANTSNSWAHGLAATNGTLRYVANMTAAGTDLRVYALRWGGSTNYTCEGHAVLRPYALTADAFAAATGMTFAAAATLTNCHWLAAAGATNRLAGVCRTMTPLDGDDTPVLLTASGSAATLEKGEFVLELSYRGSWTEQYWPDPDPMHYYVPNLTPSQAGWANPYNWITFPVDVPCTTTFRGKTLTYTNTCNNVTDLEKAGVTVTLPPFPYPGIAEYDPEEACALGHHSWESCTCRVCGKVREHSFAGNCATCANANTTVKKDGSVWVTVETGACGAVSTDEDDHGPWHDGGGKCVCTCEKMKLDHAFADELAEGAEWEDAGDDHVGYALCTRCNEAKKRIHRPHAYDVPDSDESAYEDYDEDYHIVRADSVCTDCGHKVPDGETTLQAHVFDPNNGCKCKCGHQTHQALFTNACGVQQCDACGMYVDPEAVAHTFGAQRPELGNQAHSCLCGYKKNGTYFYTEEHSWGDKVYTWDGWYRECSVCGYREFGFAANGDHVWPAGSCGAWPCTASHTFYCADIRHPELRLYCNLPHETTDADTSGTPSSLDALWHVWTAECSLRNPDLDSPHVVDAVRGKHKWTPTTISTWDGTTHYYDAICDRCQATKSKNSSENHERQTGWRHSGDTCICTKYCATDGCGWSSALKTDTAPYLDDTHRCKHCGTLAGVANEIHTWDKTSETGGTYPEVATCTVCGQQKTVYVKADNGKVVDPASNTASCPHCNPNHDGLTCLCLVSTPAAVCGYCAMDVTWTSVVLDVETIPFSFTLDDPYIYEVTTWLCVGRMVGTGEVVGSYTYTTFRKVGSLFEVLGGSIQ